MKVTTVSVTIHYRLAKIVTPLFNCYLPKQSYESFEIEYEIEPNFNVKTEQNGLNLELDIKGYLVATMSGECIRTRILHLEILFLFEVQELQNHLKKQQGKIEFKKTIQPVLNTVLSHSLSMAAGMLHERLRGTPYHDKLLPHIEPEVFFKKTPA